MPDETIWQSEWNRLDSREGTNNHEEAYCTHCINPRIRFGSHFFACSLRRKGCGKNRNKDIYRRRCHGLHSVRLESRIRYGYERGKQRRFYLPRREMGDPYLQVTKDDRDIEAIRKVLQSEETFGKYTGEVESNSITWYVAEKAAAAMIGEKACLVCGYECDFSSAEVQSILGSIQWAG